jgi:hypothetical protein
MTTHSRDGFFAAFAMVEGAGSRPLRDSAKSAELGAMDTEALKVEVIAAEAERCHAVVASDRGNPPLVGDHPAG